MRLGDWLRVVGRGVAVWLRLHLFFFQRSQLVGSQEKQRARGEAGLREEIGVPYARVEHVLEQLSRAIGDVDGNNLFATRQLDEQSRVAVDLGPAQALLAPERQQATGEELDVVDRAYDS